MYNVLITRFNRGNLFNIITFRNCLSRPSWKLMENFPIDHWPFFFYLSCLFHSVSHKLSRFLFQNQWTSAIAKLIEPIMPVYSKNDLSLFYEIKKNTLLSIFSETMKPIGVGYSSRERLNLSEVGHLSKHKRGWPSVTDDAVGYIGCCFRWRGVN